MSKQQALAILVLWNSGQFDTADIAALLTLTEDAVYRTVHATRFIQKVGHG
ncbi:MAG: hypothetical protein JKY98_05280 [Gammaproteobacteria bacterium]|nr:hypothetical protein [Gammaproteobacteria bacterium]